jgi:hypothetical protein
MDRPADYFSCRYAQARHKFLEMAAAAGLQCTAHLHPLPGREAEALAMDVVIDGGLQAENVLLVSSGCHGVEGFAGSGVQVLALQDQALRKQAQAAGVALVHIHALNPFGFSHLRRTTHENVDLNRNFHDFSRPLPLNQGYRRVHRLLLPDQWPPPAQNEAALFETIQAEGVAALQAVVARGQHEYADGLFFGGSQPCWSNLTLRRVLCDVASHARRLVWIDLHTGLGPPGVGERILACEGSAAEQRARSWWGTAVTSVQDGSSASTYATGPMWTAARDECPQAEYTGIALEYGTVPVLDVLQALRAANWLQAARSRGGERPPEELVEQVSRQMMQAFFIDTDEWKEQVLAQGREVISQAVAGLGGAAVVEIPPL